MTGEGNVKSVSGQSKCAGCIYYASLSETNNGVGYFCDYIGATNRARSKICDPGEACTVRAAEREDVLPRCDRGGYLVSRGRRGHRPARALDAETVRKMAGDGMSCKKIAEALHSNTSCVFRFCKKHGIPCGGMLKRKAAET